MSMTHGTEVLKVESSLARQLSEMQTFVRDSNEKARPVHEVEKGLWTQLLQMGRDLLGEFLRLAGDGAMGDTLTLPTGEEVRRLDKRHERRYVSIFGTFRLQRAVYGSREGQKIEFVPLDNRLDLPSSAFSYVLQNWDQSLCVEQAFGQGAKTIERILGFKQSVDSLEHMNQEMAQGVTDFMMTRPAPESPGDIVVASADQKGIVMRRQADDPPAKGHRTKGDKASRKRMATVGTVYTVDRYRRTPEEVVAALFRDAPEPATDRPKPYDKDVWASLPTDDEPGSGINHLFAWMLGELYVHRLGQRPLVFLADGQEALWDAKADWLPERTVGVLDILHVMPRLWQAAHVFCAEASQAAEDFVRERALRVLQGKTADVIRGLRQMVTKRGVTGSKKRTITTVCNYFENNLERMRYDDYLQAGYPIASGAVEGACRHLVNDRMERAGMHWAVPGAQAMLDVRSIHASGLWDEYQAARIQRETKRLYPHRDTVVSHNLAA